MTLLLHDPAAAATQSATYMRVMGCDAHVILVAAPLEHAQLHALVTTRLAALEARWTRFSPSSEVSRLGRAAGQPVAVHPETLHLLVRAATAWRRTDGHVDPTLGDAIRTLGYDRTFAALDVVGEEFVGAPALPSSPCRRKGTHPLEAMVVDPHASTVALPPGTQLDVGAIGKGFAADLAVADVVAAGARGAVVNLGGDIRAAGSDARGAAWGVVLAADARRGAPSDVGWYAAEGDLLALPDGGAVATSTVRRRRWRTSDGTVRHHLLDPGSGLPVEGHGPRTATVVATTAWWADAAATAVLAAGPDALALATRLGLPTRLAWSDGTGRDLNGLTDLLHDRIGTSPRR